MKRTKLLEKVKSYVPFVYGFSDVEYKGKIDVSDVESYTRTHKWQNGWREEGQLLLDINGAIVGDVIHVYTNGAAGSPEWEEAESFPKGKPTYLLFYNVKFDTEEEEWASLYQIKKEN